MTADPTHSPAFWAWGIDPGSSRLGFAAIRLDPAAPYPYRTGVVGWRKPKDPTDLARSLALCRRAMDRHLAPLLGSRPPAGVGEEWPSGHPNKSLYCHTGVIHENLYDDAWPAPYFVNSTSWKKTIFGTSHKKGHAELLEWAAALGITDVDEAAALAIAVHVARDCGVTVHIDDLVLTK